MNVVRIHRLGELSKSKTELLRAAQMEAAKVWNLCVVAHKEARDNHAPWPEREALQILTKGTAALHSQSVQMVVRSFIGNIDSTRENRKANPSWKYPHKEKAFYPVSWPAQAVSIEPNRIVLPMGRGRKSLVFPISLPEKSGSVKLIWNNGYELHVVTEAEVATEPPGIVQAAVDLGEIHLAAVTTNTGQAIVVSGRGIRSIKHQQLKQVGQIQTKQSRCAKRSNRWRKLQRAKAQLLARTKRRVRDLRHKAIRKVIDFCEQEKAGSLYIGNPHGVRDKNGGRKHNQRMAKWEYGKDLAYLAQTSKQARIECFNGTERGTSSHCPQCGHKHKPKGRWWNCRKCGFTGHRDIVGSVNMHPIAFGSKIEFPVSQTYLRPGAIRKPRSSRAGTPQSCLREETPQPHALGMAPSGAGYHVSVS